MNNNYYNKKYSRYSVSLEHEDFHINSSLNNNSFLSSDFHKSRSISQNSHLSWRDYSTIKDNYSPSKWSIPQSHETNHNLYQSNKCETDHFIPLGLLNQKTHCYMNSVVQSLRHCQAFVNAVLNYRLDFDKLKLKSNEKDVNLISAFISLIHDLAYRDQEATEKSSVMFQNYHENFPDFANGEQDADEYLQFLLNKLNDVTKVDDKNQQKTSKMKMSKKSLSNSSEAFRIFLNSNKSFTTELFCGQMNNEIDCGSCNFKKPSFQVFWVLSVPIVFRDDLENQTSLEYCIQALEIRQKIHSNNCPRCHNIDSMFMTTHITHWPKYLIIHIKRKLNSGQDFKDNIRIDWPIENLFTISKSEETYRYSFIGTIDHIGSIVSGGHYLAKFRDLNNIDCWWCFNDMSVTKIENPFNEVITGNTTTYFFQR